MLSAVLAPHVEARSSTYCGRTSFLMTMCQQQRMSPPLRGGCSSWARLSSLRELEISGVTFGTWTLDNAQSTFAWDLRAFKNQSPTAPGCTRAWVAFATPRMRRYQALYLLASERVPDVKKGFGDVVPSFPLFLGVSCQQFNQAKVVECSEALALKLGLPLLSNRVRCYGGHAARVSGAQYLGRLPYRR